MSKIMNFKETHYSVRQKIGDAGSISTQNMNPLSYVTPKRLESPYGAKYSFLAENPVFQFFGLEIPYRTRVYLPFFLPFVGPQALTMNAIMIRTFWAPWGPKAAPWGPTRVL